MFTMIFVNQPLRQISLQYHYLYLFNFPRSDWGISIVLAL